jgi:hypothetical protein
MPSVSKKQHNFMAAVANNPKFAKKAGVSSAVGKEFLTADKGKTFKEGGTMKKMNPGMMAIMAKKKPMAKKEMSAEMPMKHGGKVHSDVAKDKPMMKKVAAKAVKGHEKRMHSMAKGGGIEIKGKTKGKMIKMKSGGVC